mgnify:CR=1 FL=1
MRKTYMCYDYELSETGPLIALAHRSGDKDITLTFRTNGYLYNDLTITVPRRVVVALRDVCNEILNDWP